MKLGHTFNVDADAYGYTLTRLREVKKKDGTVVSEYKDATYHGTLYDVYQRNQRICEELARESVAECDTLYELVGMMTQKMNALVVNRDVP